MPRPHSPCTSVRRTLTGTQYDQPWVSGYPVLDGTLSVAVADRFLAGEGDSFRVLESGARVGEFAAFDELDLGGGLALLPLFDDTGLNLVTILET